MHIIEIVWYHIKFLFLIVHGILPDCNDTHMQVYKRYMIQYSSIVPYYLKVDHNLTYINSMKLPNMKTHTLRLKEERVIKVSVHCN